MFEKINFIYVLFAVAAIVLLTGIAATFFYSNTEGYTAAKVSDVGNYELINTGAIEKIAPGEQRNVK